MRKNNKKIKSDLLTLQEAAEYFRVAEVTFREWARNGRYKIPHIRAGKRILYRREDLDNFVKENSVIDFKAPTPEQKPVKKQVKAKKVNNSFPTISCLDDLRKLSEDDVIGFLNKLVELNILEHK